MSRPTVGVIICAAGKGLRAGFPKNKLLIPYGESCVLQKTLQSFALPFVNEIIVAVSQEDFSEISAMLASIPKAKAILGGDSRFHSVYNALQEVKSDIVLIHDGARPFVSEKIIKNCIQSVQAFGSGICAIPCSDTIAVSEQGKILSVPDRNTLRQIQTPQGFFTKDIVIAYAQAMEKGCSSYTDDSSIFSDYCGNPTLCEGEASNKKLTYKEDFEEVARCGFGIDTHAFGKEQDFIWLAGVKIPSHSGLIAHSDGDVLVHAVMDALLSAAGLKDIGHYFPDTAERFKGASSMEMLKQVIALLLEKGYAVKNISVAIQAEKPRLARYIDEMKVSLAQALAISPTAVGISAGTNEGLGYVGEGKGITANAYVLLKNRG